MQPFIEYLILHVMNSAKVNSGVWIQYIEAKAQNS